MISTMWGPQTIAKLVNKSPMNTIVISTINHSSYWSYVHQLSDFVNGGPMISRWLCLNRLHPSVGESTCSLHVLPKKTPESRRLNIPCSDTKIRMVASLLPGLVMTFTLRHGFSMAHLSKQMKNGGSFHGELFNQMVYTVPIKIPGDVPLFIVNSLFLWLLGIPSRIEKAGNSWGCILGEPFRDG